MRHIRTFISVLLLSFFGLSLAADLFASDSRVCLDDLGIQISAAGDSSAQALAGGNQPNSHDSEKNDCGDPCHYGRCHLGHCSVVFSEAPVRLQALDLTIEAHSLNQSVVEAPFLEGPRRPPRFV